ncbi:aromatic ring-hydroxylating dioxygenase subunit alpha [Aestuariivirga sp.]|uniref:aromatic ring-hydroxylating oxygenase subunit alpha n=1 Tax=Aestuariivirga sp. TaxID=2650926 RepID=UPI003593CDC7
MNIQVLRRGNQEGAVCTNPSESFTLPARFYTDPAIYEAEKTAIFYKSWWCAGHKSQLPKPGSYITTEIHEQGVVVTRDQDGKLRAFYNVCQHRGHELVKGAGEARIFTCPYHAWTYNLDGTLRTARLTKALPDFKACDFALKPVRVEEFCGFVFVNLDQDAISLKEQSGALEEEIRKYVPRIDDMVFAHRDDYVIKANWKVVVDNFLECYHCHPAHRDFVDLVDMDSYRNIINGLYVSQISDAPRTTTAKAYSFEKGDVDFGYAGWYLWPNLTLWVYPGEPNISALIMIPDGTDRTIEHLDWFLPTTEVSDQVRQAMAYMDKTLQPEDIALCESVQRGLKSRGYNQGRFVIDPGHPELSEHGVHHFQRMVARALSAELG